VKLGNTEEWELPIDDKIDVKPKRILQN